MKQPLRPKQWHFVTRASGRETIFRRGQLSPADHPRGADPRAKPLGIEIVIGEFLEIRI